MGIPRGSARLLIDEAKARPFSGTVLQLGRSSVYFSAPELHRWADRQGFSLHVHGDALSHDPRLAAQGCMGDVPLFEALGFDRVESSDISEWEGADHVFDLNEPIPEELEGKFDAVFETGTIVQIFDLPRVLENLHRLLRPGGRIIHCAVPSNNHMDLGFYMLSPTFFADYYRENGYRIESLFLCEYFAYWHAGRLHSDRWRIYDYQPGLLDHLSYGRYGGSQAATFVVATKVEGATGDRSPQLGVYRSTWEEFDNAEGDEGDRVAGLKRSDADSAGAKIEQSTAGSATSRRLGVTAKRLVESVRRRLGMRRLPKPIARY